MWLSLNNVDLTNRRVLLRVDYNVSLDNKGNILDDNRIRASIKTLKYLLDNHVLYVVIISHLGRPKGFDKGLSLKRLIPLLENLLKENVAFVPNISEFEAVRASKPDVRVFLLENIRFFSDEPKNSMRFAKKLARLGELYINDAFSVCHRAHASIDAIARLIQSFPGFRLEKEVNELSNLLKQPEKPFITILGGAKLSTKLKVIKNLLTKVDYLLLGGAMIFTFYEAQGLNTGSSLVEEKFINTARRLLNNPKLILPGDVVVLKSWRSRAKPRVYEHTRIPDSFIGLDIGPKSIEKFKELLKNAKTVFWNGPLGYVEDERFINGTLSIARFLTTMKAKVIVGGGDTIWFLKQQGLIGKYSFTSTGGGASLAFLAGEQLPGLKALGYYEKNNHNF